MLADKIVQASEMFAVQDLTTGQLMRLSNAANCADQLSACPLRFVLSDELTALCAELALSRGAPTIACADLLRVPAQMLWMEWCNAPWMKVLQRFGISEDGESPADQGRRGALIRATADGRRGSVRTFWTVGGEGADVLASSMEAYFDFDTQEHQVPEPPDDRSSVGIKVDDQDSASGVLARCFRFRFEPTWKQYYAGVTGAKKRVLQQHALGTIAFDIPVLLSFLLLSVSRTGLPRQQRSLERLNKLRRRAGKKPLLDHIQVHAPLLPEYLAARNSQADGGRRGPRLHHVRGHLVRRGGVLFWRVPHLRGSVRCGRVRTRTIIWTFDKHPSDTREGIPAAKVNGAH
ncbi:MAG TPA: hypothetical protein VK695_16495 [Steroidobacteraceae bacterium]|jgi:hypothetical protein|nr:hypothetical protein [Steroidobacteraceae bacterium]